VPAKTIAVRLVLIGLAATPAATQSFVVPAEVRAVEGDGLSALPFAYDQVRCTQYLGRSLLASALPVGKQIVELAYRRDGLALPAVTLEHATRPAWEIRLGNYLADPRNPSPRYLGPGTDFDTLAAVFQRMVQFPSLPSGAAPRPFSLRFKLDRPFVYLGASLAIDHFAFDRSQDPFDYYVDGVRRPADRGTFQAYGTSCPSADNRAYAIPSNPGGDPLELLLLGARADALALAFIGASRSSWGSLRLPLDLSALGLNGCSLLVSPDLMVPVRTFTTGGATLRVSVPAEASLAGSKLYTQWSIADDRIHRALPLTFSNGVEITLGSSVGRVAGSEGALLYGVGTAARSDYGIVDAGFVLVTEIVYQ
jgi:hypothetical protein